MQQRVDLETTAYHEAGHAVIGWLCDRMLGEITIRPDYENDISGSVQNVDQGINDLFEFRELAFNPDAPGRFVVRTGETTVRHLTENERHWLDLNERLSELGEGAGDEAKVMFYAAGQEAHRRFDPGSVEPHRSADDWDNAYESLERLAEKRGESLEAVRADLTARTAEVLSDPLVWKVVTATAKELLEAETLNGQVVTAIIRQTVCQASDNGQATEGL